MISVATIRVIVALATLALPLTAHAKREPIMAGALPAWLREARERIADPHAPWTLLHDEIIVEPLAEGGVRITTRIAARATSLNALKGFRSFNVVHGPDDRVLSAEGWSIQPDGTMLRPDPKDDVSDIPWIDGAEVAHVRARHVQLPGVVPGSIVAWEYQVHRGLDTGAKVMQFGSSSAPTRLARATLRVPEGWSFEVSTRGASFTERRSASEVALELTDLRPPRPDPVPAPDSESLPGAWLRWFSPENTRGFRDWDSVGRWYSSLVKDASARAPAGGLVDVASRELAPPSPASPEAMRAAIERAFRFASRDVRYVAIEIGIGGYRPALPEATCRDRFGDCKAKSFLMRSLVEPWGLKAWPVMVRTRSEGPVQEDVPTPSQFNHLIVALELPPTFSAAETVGWAVVDVPGIGRLAFLDPTVTNAPSSPLRSDDQGTLALLVHDTGARLIRLPEQQPEQASKRVELEATISEVGLVTAGRITSTWTGFRAAAMREAFLSATEATRAAWAAERVQDVLPGTTFSEALLTGLDDVMAPITEAGSLSGGRLAQRAMDLLIILPGTAAPPILSDRPAPPPRPWPLDLGAPRTLDCVVLVHPPSGWMPEKLPAPWTLATPHLSARMDWEAGEDGTLTWTRRVQVLRAIVPPEEYADFHRALQAIASHDAEGLTLIARGP